MYTAPPTRWTLIRKAAHGFAPDRDDFALLYEPVVRRYLEGRWRHTPFEGEIDDAVQEVFLDCFRENGALNRVTPGGPGGFRAFLFGVTRNAARHVERAAARRRQAERALEREHEGAAEEDPHLSRVFDRAFAEAIVRAAGERQRERATEHGAAAQARVELLRLRFEDGLPLREIARLWGEDPDRLHHEYARARREFHEALAEVVAYHHPGTPGEVEEECRKLLGLLE
jgi:RNA polymerase sigma-70 factor (ECF subfamily)